SCLCFRLARPVGGDSFDLVEWAKLNRNTGKQLQQPASAVANNNFLFQHLYSLKCDTDEEFAKVLGYCV
ncbi:hypothetical protein, partial [Neisseria iguanae]